MAVTLPTNLARLRVAKGVSRAPFDQTTGGALRFPKARARDRASHGRGVPDKSQARKLPRGTEGKFGRFEVKTHLRLEKVHGDGHTSGEGRAVPVQDQQVVDVEDASDTQLL